MSPSPEDPKQLPSPDGVQPLPPSARSVEPSVIDGQLPTASVRLGVGVVNDIGDNNITTRAEQIRRSSDEAMVWQEAPSLALLFPRFLRYVVFMAVIYALCWGANRFVAANSWVQPMLSAYGVKASPPPLVHPSRKARSRRSAAAESEAAAAAAAENDSDSLLPNQIRLSLIFFLVKTVFAVFFVLRLFFYLLKLNTTKYSATSQRLIVESGSFHAVNRPYELHQLGDAVIHKPLLLRPFEIANLVIDKPRIRLVGLRNAEYVRDILRQGGQLEAQRADKARWR